MQNLISRFTALGRSNGREEPEQNESAQNRGTTIGNLASAVFLVGAVLGLGGLAMGCPFLMAFGGALVVIGLLIMVVNGIYQSYTEPEAQQEESTTPPNTSAREEIQPELDPDWEAEVDRIPVHKANPGGKKSWTQSTKQPRFWHTIEKAEEVTEQFTTSQSRWRPVTLDRARAEHPENFE